MEIGTSAASRSGQSSTPAHPPWPARREARNLRRREGLKAATTTVLSATWQRCRARLMKNVLAHAGKSGRHVVSPRTTPSRREETLLDNLKLLLG